MAQIGVSHIDYFSLDVEGSELAVLQSIDWSRLSVALMSVEHIRTPSLEPRNAHDSTFLREHAGMVRVHETCFPKQVFRLADETTGVERDVHGVRICDGFYANPRLVDVAAALTAQRSWPSVIKRHQRHPDADRCRARDFPPIMRIPLRL